MTPRSLAWSSDVAVLVAGGAEVGAVAVGSGPGVGSGVATVVRSPTEPTFWWGNFLLLDSVPADGTTAVAAFGGAFPDAAHVTVGFDDPAARATDAGWWAANRFVLDETVVLTASTLVPPGRTSGLTCRPLDGAADWDCHADLAMRCRDGAPGITEDFVAGRQATRRRLVEAGRAQWWGAFAPDGLLVGQVGMVDVGGGLARYQSVETDPGWRRRGIAGELVWRAGVAAGTDLGATEVVIVADPAYWAVQIYRGLGFVDAEWQLQATLPPV